MPQKNLEREVLRAIYEGCCTLKAVTERVGCHRATALRWVRRLHAAGHLDGFDAFGNRIKRPSVHAPPYQPPILPHEHNPPAIRVRKRSYRETPAANPEPSTISQEEAMNMRREFMRSDEHQQYFSKLSEHERLPLIHRIVAALEIPDREGQPPTMASVGRLVGVCATDVRSWAYKLRRWCIRRNQTAVLESEIRDVQDRAMRGERMSTILRDYPYGYSELPLYVIPVWINPAEFGVDQYGLPLDPARRAEAEEILRSVDAYRFPRNARYRDGVEILDVAALREAADAGI